MADPFRLRVLKALTSALEGITIESGYTHDLSASVFRGKTQVGENDSLPLITVLEDAKLPAYAPTGTDNPGGAAKWPLTIQGFVDDDGDNPTDPAHRLMADVKRKLTEIRSQKIGHRPNILGMETRVMGMNFTPGITQPSDETSGKAFFLLTVTLEISENLADPYA